MKALPHIAKAHSFDLDRNILFSDFVGGDLARSEANKNFENMKRRLIYLKQQSAVYNNFESERHIMPWKVSADIVEIRDEYIIVRNYYNGYLVGPAEKLDAAGLFQLDQLEDYINDAKSFEGENWPSRMNAIREWWRKRPS